ncbi:MAG: hypothetical protein ACRD3C_21365, partial [Vicinamibacterales bacterium]
TRTEEGRMRRYAAAIAMAVVMAAPATDAQQQTTDLKQVLFRMAGGGGGFRKPIGLGLLRGNQNEDSVLAIEFWATGTMREVTPKGIGPQVQLKSVYGQIGYDFPGMRVDITRADGQREIQVVSGTFAWNEIDKIGGGLQPGWGSAVPAMDTVTDRLLRLWTTPIGLYKAAATAGAKTQVTVENGAVVLTFPFTAGKPMTTANLVVGQLEGTPVKVTLDSLYRPARVEVRYRDRVYVTTYADYGDLNEADYKSDVYMPARIAQTVDGQAVLDLTIQKTNTYNPYVLMPVPESVQKAAGR